MQGVCLIRGPLSTCGFILQKIREEKLVFTEVGVRLIWVPLSTRGFILQKIREEKLVFAEVGVRLMQGVCLIWGPLKRAVYHY